MDKLEVKQKRPKCPQKKKRYPIESPQGITVKTPWTSPTPQEATPKTASPPKPLTAKQIGEYTKGIFF